MVVSGGHTQIILIKKLGNYKILGETRDDAAGEAFDKIARILGLPYPGGPAIATVAKNYRGATPVILPRPMMHTKDYDFSFSGLKTAVLYDYKKRSPREKSTKKYISAMAYEAQQAIVDVLTKKTIKAAKDHKAKTILLGGGVAANDMLKKTFKEKVGKQSLDFQLHFCEAIHYTDNAAMIAATACFRWNKMSAKEKRQVKEWEKIRAQPNLRL